MSVETITIVLSAIGIVVTLGSGTFAGMAWMVRRMDGIEVRAIVRAQRTDDRLDLFRGELKTDIAELRTELKADIAELRGELKTDVAELRTELKTDVAELRTELKADIAGLRTEFKTEVAGLRGELKTDVGGLRGELKTDVGSIRADLADVKRELTEVKVSVARRNLSRRVRPVGVRRRVGARRRVAG
jgi:ribosomal protein L29